MTKFEKIREFYEAAFLQQYLEDKQYRIIYVDEFHVSMRGGALYNWSPRGSPAIISVNYEKRTMSFIIALSWSGVEGLLASNKSINSELFVWFIRDIWQMAKRKGGQEEKVWILWDNSSMHVSQKSTEFMKQAGIPCLTIPPYCPQLNAAEKAIALIKFKLRSGWVGQAPINLILIKTIVDNIDVKQWENLVKSSRIETIRKMQLLNISE